TPPTLEPPRRAEDDPVGRTGHARTARPLLLGRRDGCPPPAPAHRTNLRGGHAQPATVSGAGADGGWQSGGGTRQQTIAGPSRGGDRRDPRSGHGLYARTGDCAPRPNPRQHPVGVPRPRSQAGTRAWTRRFDRLRTTDYGLRTS